MCMIATLRSIDHVHHHDYQMLLQGRPIRRGRKIKYAFLNRSIALVTQLEDGLITILQYLQRVRHLGHNFGHDSAHQDVTADEDLVEADDEHAVANQKIVGIADETATVDQNDDVIDENIAANDDIDEVFDDAAAVDYNNVGVVHQDVGREIQIATLMCITVVLINTIL